MTSKHNINHIKCKIIIQLYKHFFLITIFDTIIIFYLEKYIYNSITKPKNTTHNMTSNTEKVKNILQLLRNTMDSTDIEAIILDYLTEPPEQQFYDEDYEDDPNYALYYGIDYDEVDRYYEEQYQQSLANPQISSEVHTQADADALYGDNEIIR